MPNLLELLGQQGAPGPSGGQATNVMAAMGRGGDNTVGHLTEGEFVVPRIVLDSDPQLMAAILKAFGKASQASGQPLDWRSYLVGAPQTSVNPETGAQEFKAGGGAGGSSGGGDPDRDGGSSRSRGEGPSFGGSGQTTRGNANFGGNASSTAGQGSQRAQGLGPAFAGAQLRDPSRISKTGPQDTNTNAAASQDFNPLTRMENLFTEPFTQEDFGTALGMLDPSGIVSGLNTLRDVFGLEGEPDPPEGKQGGRNEPQIRNGRTVAPTVAGAPISFSRPNPVTLPGSLGLSSAMNNLQQRAAIATDATQGSSVYRSQKAQDYYKNLLRRALIGDNGELGEFGQVLPVENQYLRSLLGASYQPNTSSLLAAIAATR